jgi:hypothetical protein
LLSCRLPREEPRRSPTIAEGNPAPPRLICADYGHSF